MYCRRRWPNGNTTCGPHALCLGHINQAAARVFPLCSGTRSPEALDQQVASFGRALASESINATCSSFAGPHELSNWPTGCLWPAAQSQVGFACECASQRDRESALEGRTSERVICCNHKPQQVALGANLVLASTCTLSSGELRCTFAEWDLREKIKIKDFLILLARSLEPNAR